MDDIKNIDVILYCFQYHGINFFQEPSKDNFYLWMYHELENRTLYMVKGDDPVGLPRPSCMS